MTRPRHSSAPLDELRLRLLASHGQEPLRVAGDGALVRLPDGTLGVVAASGQASRQVRVVTADGRAVFVDGAQRVPVLATPGLAAKLLIHLAQPLTALEHADGDGERVPAAVASRSDGGALPAPPSRVAAQGRGPWARMPRGGARLRRGHRHAF